MRVASVSSVTSDEAQLISCCNGTGQKQAETKKGTKLFHEGLHF